MMISANTSSYMDKDEQERCESVAEFSVGKTGHNHWNNLHMRGQRVSQISAVNTGFDIILLHFTVYYLKILIVSDILVKMKFTTINELNYPLLSLFPIFSFSNNLRHFCFRCLAW